ncbi:hypothetical protein ACMD2_02587 [Ananas comosus]|uniref:DUF7653 domain-containing protein n=1 Tax=Ananas comosus TaxID=4615 RepID=A0A199V827_ANACO|nr:hypothetical protein ACMD2_02587 [Ananas comosus]
MRRFFSFRSSAANNGCTNVVPPTSNHKKKDAKTTAGETLYGGSRTPEESSFKSRKSKHSLVLRTAIISFEFFILCSCHSSTPERHAGKRGNNLTEVRKSLEAHEFDSPCSRGYLCSSGNSSYSSPIALRCGPIHKSNFSNNNEVLDLYIDGEQDVINKPSETRGNFSRAVNDGTLSGKPPVSILGKPPRAQSTAPSSPTSTKDSLRTYSFRDDVRIAFAAKNLRRNNERQSHLFTGKLIKLRDHESETTTTIEDIYEDTSEELHGPRGQTCYLENGSLSLRPEKSSDSSPEEQDTDEKLLRKAKEMEERFTRENSEIELLRNKGLSLTELLQMIQDMNEDRKYLALELSSQIRSRLAERFSAKEQYKQSKVELDTRTRRLEKEKSEVQLTLEKELDRRSNDWSQKLVKFQTEEQRLRERVRELAEQNVALQREVSSLQANEAAAHSRLMNSETQCKELTATAEEVQKKNNDLRQILSEMEVQFNEAKEERDQLKRSYKEKEEENKGLHKMVVRLQRIRNEQDKTISGLRQGYSDELDKKSRESGDSRSRLQMELMRLTGIEQKLRREVESCVIEIESLRNENISLIDRFQSSENGYRLSSIRLEQELRARVDCLQTRALSLLDDNSHFCAELLEFIKCKKHENQGERRSDLEGYSIVEYTLKYQSIKRGVESLRRSLQTVLAILDDKSTLEASESVVQSTEGGNPKHAKDQAQKDEIELKLKVEVMLTRVLREKLYSKELDLEQLQAELASSVRSQDVLQNEIQRLQDEFSCLNHKAKEMEIQMLKKDESINQIQQDLQDSMKELSALRGTLKTVTEERDIVWQEANNLRKTNMRMLEDAHSLRRKIEALDEDILLKEGQISILKDSLEKPFDIICSPKSLKEFDME